ncbi:MAG: TonB-dependent receptor [Verrucomicrobiaceae bacterium]|nr:MAG: TonB-dependent receptor [Verrucomicrobiaceae bacterium]
MYYPGFSNPNLQPEKSKNYEGGVRYRQAGTTASLIAYHNKVDNLIQYQGRATVVNKDATLKGVTLTAAQQFGATSVRGSVDIVDPKDNNTGEQLTRRARQVLKLAGGVFRIHDQVCGVAESVSQPEQVLGTFMFAAVLRIVARDGIVDEKDTFQVFLPGQCSKIGGTPQHGVGNPEEAPVFPTPSPSRVYPISPFRSGSVHQVQSSNVSTTQVLQAFHGLEIRQTTTACLPFSHHPESLRGIPKGSELLRREALRLASPDRFQFLREGFSQTGVDHGESCHTIHQVIDGPDVAEPLQIGEIHAVDTAGAGEVSAFAQPGNVEMSHARPETRSRAISFDRPSRFSKCASRIISD